MELMNSRPESKIYQNSNSLLKTISNSKLKKRLVYQNRVNPT